MLKKIENLPPSVLGLQAEGQLTRNDYEKVMVPLLEDAHRRVQRVRFLWKISLLR